MGRPHKGTRARLNLRIPLTLYVALSRLAAQRDVDLNAYATAVLTEHVRENQ